MRQSRQTIRRAEQLPGALKQITRIVEFHGIPDSGLEITIKAAKRTNLQNAHYWLIVTPLVAEHLTEQHGFPYTKDMAHELLKSEFLPTHQDPKTSRIFYGSTTELTRSGGEGSWQEYMQKIQRWAAMSGLQIPDPNEAKQ